MDSETSTECRNPRPKTNVFSTFNFCWLIPLLLKGRKGCLRQTDIYDCPETYSSDRIGESLNKEWKKEADGMKRGKKPSLLKAAIRSFGRPYLLNSSIAFIERCILHVLMPIFLGFMIKHFARMNDASKTDITIYACGVCLIAALCALLRQPFIFTNEMIGMKIRIACSNLIYRKALKLSPLALKVTNVGQMVNLLSNDVNKFDKVIIYLPFVFVSPVQTIVTTVVLWTYIGYAGVAGVSILLLYAPFLYAMGRHFSKLRQNIAVLTDQRIQLMSEIISGIRVIKMYGWEFPFANLVNISRRNEVKKIQHIAILRSIYLAISFVSSKVTLLIVFSVLVIGMSDDLTPEKVFVTMVLFNNLRQTLCHTFPNAVAEAAEGLVSIRRIQKFLFLEQLHENLNLKQTNMRPELSSCGVWTRNIVASWNNDHVFAVPNVTLSVRPGELLAVVGPVGCGKTSLLMSILGELRNLSGEVKIQGSVAYAAQDPWVFSGNVRQNILFGSSFDENKYITVVNACALQEDIKVLPYGDQTQVGERGYSLSRGQKSRVNLARAMYYDADIYLLDDPLSAVDAKVSKHIYENCINGYLKEKVKILVTHQIHFLKDASSILVLKEGECVAHGTYKDLIESEVDFGCLKGSYRQENLFSDSLKINKVSSALEKSTNFAPASNFSEPSESNEAKISKKVPRIAEDTKAFGSVKFKIYKEYVKSGSGPCLQSVLLISYIAAQFFFNGSDFWLSIWTKQEQSIYNVNECWAGANKSFLSGTGYYNTTYGISDKNFFQFTVANVSERCFILTNNYLEDRQDALTKRNTEYNLSLYAGLVLILIIFSIIRIISFFMMCMNASVSLHNQMFWRILRSPSAFFDRTPIGNILNRCSRDLGYIDDVIPQNASETVETFFTLLGIIVIISIVEPWMLVPFSIIIVSSIFIRRFYLPTARDVKRYEGIKRSPVFSHMSTSLSGLTTIRAFKAQQAQQMTFDRYQDKHTSTWVISKAVTRWFSFVLDILLVMLITSVTISMISLSEDPSYASRAGLAIATSFDLFGRVQLGIKQSAEFENQMTCVERVIEYCNLESESDLESKNDKRPPSSWPNVGHIVFQNVSLRYFQDEPPVLKNLNFQINPKEKIGIVGRTGAGKSSLISCFFRMTEPEGDIKIDDISIQDIGLHDLRKKISIVPQDPVLFNGSIRLNLDPFNEHSDDDLWQALDEVHMKRYLRNISNGLNNVVSEGGSNFSVGQRQLICLARAIIRRNKILIFDEATANVDPNTDRLIQKTLKEHFTNCTVFTVAHRLHTVIDSDRLLVIDGGEIKEFDEPYELLQDCNSLFFKMVQMTGPAMSQILREMTQNVHRRNVSDKKESNKVYSSDSVIEKNSITQNCRSTSNSPSENVSEFPVSNMKSSECTKL